LLGVCNISFEGTSSLDIFMEYTDMSFLIFLEKSIVIDIDDMFFIMYLGGARGAPKANDEILKEK